MLPWQWCHLAEFHISLKTASRTASFQLVCLISGRSLQLVDGCVLAVEVGQEDARVQLAAGHRVHELITAVVQAADLRVGSEVGEGYSACVYAAAAGVHCKVRKSSVGV